MKDIDIARKVVLKPIAKIAEKLGIPSDQIEPYGHNKAKLPVALIKPKELKKSNLILVSAPQTSS